jgi:hypothetical protein
MSEPLVVSIPHHLGNIDLVTLVPTLIPLREPFFSTKMQ